MIAELAEKVEAEEVDLDKVSSVDLLNSPLDEAELMVLGLLKKTPDVSRNVIADQISKDVKTVQKALDSLIKKGYIRKAGSKRRPVWEILK